MAVLVVLTWLGLCASSTPGAAADEPPPPRDPVLAYVEVQTARQWVAHGAVTFLDVRAADEFAAGHLPGAINIPHDQVQTLAEQLPHEQPIVVYCIHSAHRAPDAAKRLKALGFGNAYVLEGGIVAWEAGGQTIQANDLAATPTILPMTSRCAELGATTDRVRQ